MITGDYRDDLLGGDRDEAPQIPIVCHVRSGIMRLVRLKQDATEDDRKRYEADMKVYNEEVAKGSSWDDIKKKVKGNLTPQNEDYFTCREVDCKTFPQNAKTLHDLYADFDGHIRRLPITFFFDDWFQNMPHSLSLWTSNELKYWSRYRKVRDDETGETGYERVCMRSIPRTKKRAFGGRDAEAWRLCDPEECPDYQAERGGCQLSGYIQGVVPGVRGGGLTAIHTKSIYSYMQIQRKMKMISAGTGRLRGLYRPGTDEPLFFIRKVGDEEISRFDPQKQKSVKVTQDLINIECDIDLNDLLLE
jgi:hypothetical protein